MPILQDQCRRPCPDRAGSPGGWRRDRLDHARGAGIYQPAQIRCEGKLSVLTDLDSGYALELQLAIKIEDEKRLAMTRAGWDISAFQDNENWTLPIPATFVVGSDGSVKARFVDPDYRKRMDVDDILDALRT